MRSKISNYIIIILITLSFTSFIQSGALVVEAQEEIFNPWYFIALGDSRNWHENESNPFREAIIDDVVENNPNMDFILHSGDMVLSGGEQSEWDRYYEDIDSAVENNVTFYYAVGNHERYTYRLEDGSYGPIQTNCSTYMANVELPGNERYYSFDHNQIHFIVINTEEDWDDDNYFFDITTAQYDWIIDDLENNDKSFIVAMFHRPCYSIRSNYRVENANEIRKVLEPIFIDYGVDLVFSGHDHYYYRTTRNGITHVVTGGSGAPLYNPERSDKAIEGDVYFDKYHYVNVSVSEEEIKLESLAYAGDNIESPSILDTYKLDQSETEKTVFFPIFISIIMITFLKRKR